jgi:hypothetical protein
MQIERGGGSAQYTLTNNLNTTPQIDITNFSVGQIHIPAGSPITSLTFYAAPERDGTYLPLKTSTGAAVTQTVAQNNAYDWPAPLAGCRFIKIVADNGATITIVGES